VCAVLLFLGDNHFKLNIRVHFFLIRDIETNRKTEEKRRAFKTRKKNQQGTSHGWIVIIGLDYFFIHPSSC
jgi:hypothetical protein